MDGFVSVVLPLQDYALLVGSIGLAVVMFLSRNISWYSPAEDRLPAAGQKVGAKTHSFGRFTYLCPQQQGPRIAD